MTVRPAGTGSGKVTRVARLRTYHNKDLTRIMISGSKKNPTDPWNRPQISQNTNMTGFPSSTGS